MTLHGQKKLYDFLFLIFFPSALCNIMLLNDVEGVDVCKYNPLLVGWLVGWLVVYTKW
jgi:hypothetical protein